MKEFLNEHFLEAMPLEVSEVIHILKTRWGVTYELKIVQKGQRLYLQMMWGYLEQQSFALSEQEYRKELAQLIDVLNRLGKASEVRGWLLNIQGKPLVGRALSLPLRGNEYFEEFVI